MAHLQYCIICVPVIHNCIQIPEDNLKNKELYTIVYMQDTFEFCRLVTSVKDEIQNQCVLKVMNYIHL